MADGGVLHLRFDERAQTKMEVAAETERRKRLPKEEVKVLEELESNPDNAPVVASRQF